jgi:exopolyphosphatase/guanosine-5'-triphosphate,3'-diphosphate pyrophosphatase
MKVFEDTKRVFSKIYPVQIGEGLRANNISENKLIEIKDCFFEVQNDLEKWRAVMKRTIGTSAIRDASNSSIIKKWIREMFNTDLEIIPGSEEADLIYKGVRKGMLRNENEYLICDIGGGSVELIYCSNEQIIKAKSFEIGVIKLYKLKKNNDPYSLADSKFYFEYLDETISDFLNEINTNHLVGAAGSFESIYTLIKGEIYPEMFLDIEMQDLNTVLDSILGSTQSERDENQLIPIERKILLPLGVIIVKYLINKLEIDKFTVSPNSLLEGLDLEE